MLSQYSDFKSLKSSKIGQPPKFYLDLLNAYNGKIQIVNLTLKSPFRLTEYNPNPFIQPKI